MTGGEVLSHFCNNAFILYKGYQCILNFPLSTVVVVRVCRINSCQVFIDIQVFIYIISNRRQIAHEICLAFCPLLEIFKTFKIFLMVSAKSIGVCEYNFILGILFLLDTAYLKC